MKENRLLVISFAILSFVVALILGGDSEKSLSFLGSEKVNADAVYDGSCGGGDMGCGSGGGGSGCGGGGCSGSGSSGSGGSI